MSFLRGLYAITDPHLLPGERLFVGVEAALKGGARMIQYRDKVAAPAQKLDNARKLRDLCARYQALFFINDDVELARACGADGVHLGQSDGAAEALPDKLLVGVTCHADLALAERAYQQGAAYLAFGRFFDSPTKPGASPCSMSILKKAQQRFSCPLLAIGGVTPDNGAPLIRAGAHMLAAISGVFAATDIEAAARRYHPLFSSQEQA